METDAIIGCVLIVGALGLITYLLVWSRKSVARIARRGFGSVREIRKEPPGGT
jgi:hypothetical protein